MSETKRPNKDAVLAKLKGFQERTVAHVVERLFDESGSKRFLVADEVGLGKTLVARGVIAEVVERLWNDPAERNEDGGVAPVGSNRIDIVYVCSNTALATENLQKLHLGGECVEATRLTLLPEQIEDFDDKLNFISLTPGTALYVEGYGKARERIILYQLLKQRFDSRTPDWLKNLLRGGVKPENWTDYRLKNDVTNLNQELADQFLHRLDKEPKLLADLEWAKETLTRANRKLEGDDEGRPYWIVGALRRLLAHSCIDALEPDLIILDEFQRFKDLLGDEEDSEESTELNALARELFNYEARDGTRVPTLLLSATPYRMFAASHELGDGDPYSDFVETLRFLCGDSQQRFAELQQKLREYRTALVNAAHGATEQIVPARDALQSLLKRVMVRTERVDSTVERDAMVEELNTVAKLTKRDLKHFMATDAVAEELEAYDVVEFWKSAPYLFNFMKDYRLKKDFADPRRGVAVERAFQAVADEFLSVDQIQEYATIDPANARLRLLEAASLGDDQARMLWLPPTIPYWPLAAPWNANPAFSKKLVFSAWNVVPDAVSALLSYEAERIIVGDAEFAYSELYDRTQRPLTFSVQSSRRAGSMTLFAWMWPCLRLADEVNPLEAAIAGRDARQAARERVEQLLGELLPHVRGTARDERWFWAAPLLLDKAELGLDGIASMAELFQETDTGDADDDTEEEESEDASSDESSTPKAHAALERHIEEAVKLLRGELALGAFPEGLAESLADMALGSPSILVARSLAPKLAQAGRDKGEDADATNADGKSTSTPDEEAEDVATPGTDAVTTMNTIRRRSAIAVAGGFRTLFNQPMVVRMLRSAGSERAYWRSTLEYCVAGNLQAVIDEEVHLRWEQAAWEDETAEKVCERVATKLHDAVSTKVSHVSPDVYATDSGKAKPVLVEMAGNKRAPLPMRTSFALRYGRTTGRSGATDAREESVRTAFKSPFFPFVLISTSIGQEGLDFHPWCHEIWHWNLPGNPVDLEQREGRVHRFKGLAVRRNVAAGALEKLRDGFTPGRDDPWTVLFDKADAACRANGESELHPHWLATGEHRVRRVVPCLPYSSEVAQLRRLKRSLAIYRVAFGQPRQDDLLELLERSGLTKEQLEQWTVSLRPG